MECLFRQDRVSQIKNLSSDAAWLPSDQKNMIWTMLAWRTLDLWMNLEGHLWMKLEGHLWIWMKLEGHLWMKLDLRDTCDWNLRNTCEWILTYGAVNTCETTWQRHQLTNLQPNCMLACPQITGSTGILAYFYKRFVLKHSPRGPKETQPRHRPSFSTPLNWGFARISLAAATLGFSDGIDRRNEWQGDGQLTLNNLVMCVSV